MNEPVRRGIQFDPSIRLDNAISIIVLLIAGLSAWFNLANRVDQQARDTVRLEGSYKEADKRIEAAFDDKIKDQRAFIQQLQLTEAANIADIKSALGRIEEKLDRKADKPGLR
jgi:flagellar motility protein MotE (MotC chaperone)